MSVYCEKKGFSLFLSLETDIFYRRLLAQGGSSRQEMDGWKEVERNEAARVVVLPMARNVSWGATNQPTNRYCHKKVSSGEKQGEKDATCFHYSNERHITHDVITCVQYTHMHYCLLRCKCNQDSFLAWLTTFAIILDFANFWLMMWYLSIHFRWLMFVEIMTKFICKIDQTN